MKITGKTHQCLPRGRICIADSTLLKGVFLMFQRSRHLSMFCDNCSIFISVKCATIRAPGTTFILLSFTNLAFQQFFNAGVPTFVKLQYVIGLVSKILLKFGGSRQVLWTHPACLKTVLTKCLPYPLSGCSEEGFII